MIDTKLKNTEEVSSKFRHFSYLSNEKWLPLPDWAIYFLELGAALANYENSQKRFVAAITLPIRSFVSPLIASGLIISRTGCHNQSLQNHITRIQSLKLGTPVTFRKGNVKYEGIYKGTMTGLGKQFFKIEYQKGGEIYFSYDEAYKLEVSEKQKVTLHTIQSGRHLDPPSPLLKYLLDTESLNRFLVESKLECVILGQQNLLQQELCDFDIGYQNSGIFTPRGKIVDFVRVKGAQFQGSNLAYRSYVLPSSVSSKYTVQFVSKLNNYATIFDNPQGFIKWKNYFRTSNWIIVLDKTDRNFDIAIKEVNAEYIQNRTEKQLKLSLPIPPAGVDLMLFEVNQ